MAKEKVVEVIIDGLGCNAKLESQILEDVLQHLPVHVRRLFDTAVQEIASRYRIDEAGVQLVRQSLIAPVIASILSQSKRLLWRNRRLLDAVNQARSGIRHELGHAVWEEEILAQLKSAATCHHYAPWVASTTTLWSLRNRFPTFPTRASGICAGYEPLEIDVMGNSDTGHQQLHNLIVALQGSASIAEMIEDGTFYGHKKLIAAMERARTGHLVVIKTMLSGEYGDDGYVHSAMPHLYALLELYFERLKLPRENLQLQIVLDGRDCPKRSSTDAERIDGRNRYNFLDKLKTHLSTKYDAVACISWIIGRQYMDRNYQGAMIRGEYELIVRNRGTGVSDFKRAYDCIKALHDQGRTDAQIPPVVIGSPRPVDAHASYINAIFRADRQEPITAALLGMRRFIKERALASGTLRTWDRFEWLENLSGLTVVTMIDYHPSFTKAGVAPILKVRPHRHNILHLLSKHVSDFSFLFLGESVKAKHVGLFSRGCRANAFGRCERRKVFASYGKDQGVANDNELYKFPGMRHMEIAAHLEKVAGKKKPYDLIIANLAGPDMIGHLIRDHFEACIETVNSIEFVISKIVPVLREAGYFIIVTSDHGNVEHYNPDHGSNPVLTTVVPPAERDHACVPILRREARLFDIAATILALLGHGQRIESKMPTIPRRIVKDRSHLVGKAMVTLTG